MIGVIANSPFGLTFGLYKKYPITVEAVMRVSGMHFEEICSIAQKRGIALTGNGLCLWRTDRGFVNHNTNTFYSYTNL